MNNARKGVDPRLFAYVCVVVALLAAFNYQKLAIQLVGIPDDLKKLISRPSKLVFIDGNPCTGCPSGQFIASLKNQLGAYELVFIVPSDYTENDLSNFKRAFSVDGVFIRSDNITRRMEDSLRRAYKVKQGTGLCATISPKGIVRGLYAF